MPKGSRKPKKRPTNWTGKGLTKNYPLDPNVDAWLDDRCIPDPTQSSYATALRNSWHDWCHLNGHSPGHTLHLWQQLTARGYPKAKDPAGNATRSGIAVSERT
jgi:hypothetical protein